MDVYYEMCVIKFVHNNLARISNVIFYTSSKEESFNDVSIVSV